MVQGGCRSGHERRSLRSVPMAHILSAVAWPYANGPRHLGHVAGFGVPSDVFSRYMRMAGHDVLMVSGTDEHGTPILVEADKEGTTPHELADRSNRIIVTELAALGCSYDLFTRTTTRNHYAVAQEMFRQVHANGYLVEQTTRGAISPSTGRTLPDRYIEGTCPICGYAEARGDQCDNCGNQLDPTELKDPHSRINGEVPQFVETQHFFLDLPALAAALSTWLDGREASGTWRPNVIRFSRNILAEIRPRAMTRDIDWGIPIPLDGWRELPTKRLYVWFDAVIGYLSASIEWARRIGDPERWREWWNDPESLSYYLTMEGKQFSSSRGVVIYLRDVLERYQADALRYFICAAGPENADSDFTWREFVNRTNGELVAGWGNLVNRTAAMVAKSFGEIPAAGQLTDADEALLASVRGGLDTVGDLVSRHRQRQAIAEAMRVVGGVNKYVTDQAPFTLKTAEERPRLATILHVAAQAVWDCNTMLAPFLPHSANAVNATLGGSGDFMPMPRVDEVADLDDGHPYPIIIGDYSATPRWASTPVQVGAPVAKPTPIFTKLDDAVVEAELERLRDAAGGGD